MYARGSARTSVRARHWLHGGGTLCRQRRLGLRRWMLPIEAGRRRQAGDREDLLFIERLALEQRARERLELTPVSGEQSLRFGVTLRDDLEYFLIDGPRRLVAEGP